MAESDLPSLLGEERSFHDVADGEVHSIGEGILYRKESLRNDVGAKVVSLFLAVFFNAAILLILMWLSVTFLKHEEIELVVEAGPRDSQVHLDKRQFQQKRKAKPVPASAANATPIVSSVVADPEAVFALESIRETDSVGIGDGWGKGSSFGSGQQGGSVGFFGSRSVAQRVVFIVDVSASLSNQQFAMIKNELVKSLDRLAPSVKFQVIFFSGPAWFAEDEHSVKNKIHTIIHKGKNYLWKTEGGASRYYIESGKDLYTSSWISASQSNLRKTGRRIEGVKKSFGTDWRHPLRMALEMTPGPDVVYFLTDGVVGNGKKAVDEVIKINRRGPKAKIYTISMMQPKAEDLLKDLAEKSGGEFSIVMGDGEVKKKKKAKKAKK